MGKDPGSIPMDDPLAYFLTWTTYGSWLPGDERGWVEKPGRFRAPDAKREQAARHRMTEPELKLDPQQRDTVEKTVADHCRIRRWQLHAANCRTQHVHVVVTAPNRDPDDVLDQFKAWCTRRLKEHARLKLDAQAKQTRSASKTISKPEMQAKGSEEKDFAGASGFNRHVNDPSTSPRHIAGFQRALSQYVRTWRRLEPTARRRPAARSNSAR